jgi:hypothetical protein
MKMPYIKFFTRDWLNEKCLRFCSLQARGLWADILCLMADADEYGYLIHDGRAMTEDEISRLISTDKDTLKGPLKELRDRKVYSVDERGYIYSRRMVHDQQKRSKASEAGKGGGNPTLLYSIPSLNLKSEDITTQHPEPTLRLTLTLKGLVDKNEDFLGKWESFVEHRRQISYPLTRKAAEYILADCEKWGPEKAIEALKNSIENGWRGVFEPKQVSGGRHAEPKSFQDREMERKRKLREVAEQCGSR